MGIASLSEAAHKVDEAVSRLQKLQCTIASEIPAASSSSIQMLRRSNRRNRPEMQSFEQLTRRPSSIKLGDLDPSGGGSESGNYCRRWSSPGESLHQTVSDILVASKFAKEMAGLVARSLENGKELPTRRPKSQVQPDVSPNKQKKDATRPTDTTKPVEVAIAAATSAGKAWQRVDGKENSNPSRQYGVLLQAKQVTREQLHPFKGSSVMNIRQGKIGQCNVRPGKIGPCNVRQGNDKIITTKEKVESKSSRKGEMGQGKMKNLTPRRFKTPTQVKPLMGPSSSSILDNKKTSLQTLPSSSSCSSFSNESCSLYPKQRVKVSVGVSNRTPCKAAKVSTFPLKTETRFCINVGETATTANRPWSLARNKPSKLEPMFPSKTANTQRPSPPPIIPSPRLKQVSPKDPQTPPILLSRRVSKLSPIRGIRLHSVKSPKLFLPVSESRANNKHRYSSSVCFKLMSPRRSPRQSSTILSEKKKKHGGFLRRRFSLDPSKGFRKISLLGGVGGKHDENSPVRKPPPPLPSLITRLPSRTRYSNNGSSTPFSYQSQRPTSRFGQDCLTTSKDLLLLPKAKDFSSPLPVPPAIRAQQLREEAKAQRIGSAIIKGGRANLDIDDVVGERKVQADESEHNPLGGCSGSVWPVLKRSWSLSNMNGRGKVHSSPLILKQNKIGSNVLQRSLKVEKNWVI